MKSRTNHRIDRVANQIQHTLAAAIAARLKDPRVGFVTVTGVIVTPDLARAIVRVSVMGSEEEKTTAVEGLRSARGFLRSLLARELQLRTTPELQFEIDRGIDHAARISRLLTDIDRERGDT